MSADTTDMTTGDAWGMALVDHFEGRDGPAPILEVDGGEAVPAMEPAWFFRPYEAWDWWERELLALAHGSVLDLGAGAGRVALHLQETGLRVTAVEMSPGAADVCRRRGLHDVREGDLNDPPRDVPWNTVLLLCGNLGLGGSWDGNRELLRRLADGCADDAVLIGDSVDYDGPGELALRIRYGSVVTPWWRQRNVAASEVRELVAGTGWELERHLHEGSDHAVALRRGRRSRRAL